MCCVLRLICSLFVAVLLYFLFLMAGKHKAVGTVMIIIFCSLFLHLGRKCE